MKTTKKLFFSTLVILISAGFISVASVSASEIHKTYTWKYNVNADAHITFENYDCDLVIHTWDKAETEYHLTVDAKPGSDEDGVVLESFLQGLQFRNTSSSASFKSHFWESRNSIMGRTTMKLENGKKIVLTDFAVKAELWVPVGCSLDLTSKYSDITIENLNGPLVLDLYNDNLYGGTVKGNAEITDKYSTIEFKDMKDIRADLYNSKLEAANTGNIKIESKYSKVTALSSGTLDVNGYNDKYNINKAGDITFVAKYTDLKAESAGKVSLDFYEGSVAIKETKDVDIASKYADFHFDNAENCTISSSYNDKFEAGKLISLKINDSKYCSYRIGELVQSVIETSGYEDKFFILKTGSVLKEVKVTGKYVDVSLYLPKTTDYRFKANITYPKLDMDESQLMPKIKVKEGSQLEYDAIKGKEREGMPLIEINGYQMSLKIVDL